MFGGRKVTKVTCSNLGRTLGLAIFGLTDFINKPSAPFFARDKIS
jgi:hypothetical protein